MTTPKNIKLFTFPPVPHVYSTSAFGMKLESYFRVNQIDYQPIYTSKFSSTGTIPYIKLGDQDDHEVSDTNVIIDYFRNEVKGFQDTDWKLLSAQERATTHAVVRMLEEHTSQIGFHYRYSKKIMPKFLSSVNVPENVFNSDNSCSGSMTVKLWKCFQPGITKKKSEARGLSRHSDQDLYKFSNADLSCLEDILAATKDTGGSFFFGKEQATLIDCAVFGHVSQFVWIPIDFPQKDHIVENCPNLYNFLFNFRAKYWPDWEEKCQRKQNVEHK